MSRNTNENVNENGASSYEARIAAPATPVCKHCGAEVFWSFPRPEDPCFDCDLPINQDPVDEPTDEEIYNGFGVEGGIAYDPYDEPGSLGENDWRL